MCVCVSMCVLARAGAVPVLLLASGESALPASALCHLLISLSSCTSRSEVSSISEMG